MPLNRKKPIAQASMPAGLQTDYKNTFETESGARVLTDLRQMFMLAPVRVPIMPGEPSIEMQAGAHNTIAFIDAMLGDDHG